MRLSIKSMAIASGLLWGGAILLVSLINLSRPEYGMGFLAMMNSVYPWFHSTHTLASVVIGTIDGVIDGAVAGCLFTLLYNATLDLSAKAQALQSRHT
ncbi:MAG: hypothetical protein WA192_00645 [Candidatus Acidiferrales bacterium]